MVCKANLITLFSGLLCRIKIPLFLGMARALGRYSHEEDKSLFSQLFPAPVAPTPPPVPVPTQRPPSPKKVFIDQSLWFFQPKCDDHARTSNHDNAKTRFGIDSCNFVVNVRYAVTLEVKRLLIK